jgi:hypothetical protein
MSNWQPIETAPKDGWAVDLWHTRDGRITDAQWRGDRWEVWELDYDGAGGYVRVDSPGHITHWMRVLAPTES